MRTAATILSINGSLESLVRRKRSCGVRRGADRKVPARAENSLAAYSTLGSRSFRRSRRTGKPSPGGFEPPGAGKQASLHGGGTGRCDT